MAEQSICKRVHFPTGKQKEFLTQVLNKVSVREAASLCGVSERTIRDWRREKFLINYDALRKLSRKSKVPILKNITLKDRYWYTSLGANRGGYAVFKKYGKIGGDSEHRKKKWREWWEKDGKYRESSICVPKSIATPQKSADLAEFVGIMIGDGKISTKQIAVTLNGKDDKEYVVFVHDLILKLFNVRPSIYKDKQSLAVNIVVSRKLLVEFCTSIGLRVGNKLNQNLDIPPWVTSEKKFMIACIRGLMDTDGCIFQECHTVNRKRYCYPRVHFVSKSPTLLKSVQRILVWLELDARIRNGRSVSLEKRDDIVKYFGTVGSSNKKHLVRFKKYTGGEPAG